MKGEFKKTDMKPTQAFYNQQEKAFRQLAAIVIGFTICFLPYFVLFLIVALCNDCVNDNLFKLTIWLGYINSTLNPFLYALSNRKFGKQKNNKKNFNSHYVVSKNNNNNNISHASGNRTDTTTIHRANIANYN